MLIRAWFSRKGYLRRWDSVLWSRTDAISGKEDQSLPDILGMAVRRGIEMKVRILPLEMSFHGKSDKVLIGGSAVSASSTLSTYNPAL